MPCVFGGSVPAFREIELRELEGTLHGADGEDFEAEVQMCVDVGGGADMKELR